MDFKSAIDVHVHWKMRLAAYIAKPDRSLNHTTIEVDDRCALGKWLHGEGAKFAGSPEFDKVMKDHKHFHKVAAEIVRKANSGQSMSQDVALGAKSEYTMVSNSLVYALMKMKSAA